MRIERRAAREARGLLEYWPLLLTLLGGVVASIKFYYTLTDVIKSQQTWQASSEIRRNHQRDIQEQDHVRLAVTENNVEWIKEFRRENASLNHQQPRRTGNASETSN